MKKTKFTIFLIGLIVIAVTLATFFLFKLHKQEIYIWALSFLLLAEVITVLGIALGGKIGGSHGKSFFRSGGFVALSAYFTATFALTMLSGLFKKSIIVFIYIEIILLAVFALLILLIFLFANYFGNSDKKIVESRKFMQDCENRIYALLSESKNRSYGQHLNNLYENIKYSDKIGSSSLDDKIALQLTDLENSILAAEADESILQTINQLSVLVNQRKTELLGTKRGGF